MKHSVNKTISLKVGALQKQYILRFIKSLIRNSVEILKCECTNISIIMYTKDHFSSSFDSIEEFEMNFSGSTDIYKSSLSIFLSHGEKYDMFGNDFFINALLDKDYSSSTYSADISISSSNNIINEDYLEKIEDFFHDGDIIDLEQPHENNIPLKVEITTSDDERIYNSQETKNVSITTSDDERIYNDNNSKLNEKFTRKQTIITGIISIVSAIIGAIIGPIIGSLLKS